MNIKWNEYTSYSKLLAAIFFIIVLPVWTFYIGVKYEETIDSFNNQTALITFSQSSKHEQSTNNHYGANQDASDQTNVSAAPSVLSDSSNCPDQTNLGLSECAQGDFEKQDNGLQALYNSIINSLNRNIGKKDSGSPGYSAVKAALIKSENDWISYRDDYCLAGTAIDVPDGNGSMFSGSIAQIEYPQCKTVITADHIKDLHGIYGMWVDGSNR